MEIKKYLLFTDNEKSSKVPDIILDESTIQTKDQLIFFIKLAQSNFIITNPNLIKNLDGVIFANGIDEDELKYWIEEFFVPNIDHTKHIDLYFVSKKHLPEPIINGINIYEFIHDDKSPKKDPIYEVLKDKYSAVYHRMITPTTAVIKTGTYNPEDTSLNLTNANKN